MSTTSGAGVYFDGVTSARHDVRLELDDAALSVTAPDGHVLARWPYDDLAQLSWEDGLLRLGHAKGGSLARIEVRDDALAHAIDHVSVPVDRARGAERRSRRRVVRWSVLAVLSLVLAGVFGVPELASRLAPLVPVSLERRAGEVVDAQVRAMLDRENRGVAFECGAEGSGNAGRAALDALVAQLVSSAALPLPVRVAVVRREEPNAIALPGGRIYVFEGTLTQAKSADELAGVIAHEIGHIAHRDGTRAVLQTAGLSFLFGLVLGDFVGGGAVILAARTILQLAYSREVESAADLYSVAVMERAGGDPRALGAFLLRIAGPSESGPKILLGHPEAKERADLIARHASKAKPGTLLDPAAWAALQGICKGS